MFTYFRKTLTSFVVFVTHIVAFNACISIVVGKIWRTTLMIMTSAQWVQNGNLSQPRAIQSYKNCSLAMLLTSSGEVSPKFGHGNANFKSLLIYLDIDCFYGLSTQKYLHSMTKLTEWLRHCLLKNALYSRGDRFCSFCEAQNCLLHMFDQHQTQKLPQN